MRPNSDAGDCIIVRDSDEEGKGQVPQKARATKDMKKNTLQQKKNPDPSPPPQPVPKRRGRPPKALKPEPEPTPPIVLSDSDDEIVPPRPRVTVPHSRYHPYSRTQKPADAARVPDELQAKQPSTQMPSIKGRLVSQNLAGSPHQKTEAPNGILHAEREKHLAAINELKKTIASKDEALARKDEELAGTHADLEEKKKDYNYLKAQSKVNQGRLKDKLEALSNESEEIKAKLNQLSDGKEKLELQNKDLQTQLSQVEGERDLYCRELGSLDREKVAAEENQARQLHELKVSFEENQARQLQQQSVLFEENHARQMQEAEAAAQKKAEFLSAQLGASKLQVQALEKELVESQQSAAAHAEKLGQLEDRLRKSKACYDDLDRNYEKASNNLTQLIKHSMVAQTEVDELKKTLQAREGELQKSKSDAQRLQNELNQTLKDLSVSRSQIERHKGDLIRSETDAAKIETKYEAQVQDTKKVKVALSSQQKRANDLQDELAGTKQKLESLKKGEELSKQRLDKSKKESAQLREEVGALSKRLEVALEKCEAADQVLGAAENDTKTLEKKVKEANDSIMELKRQLEVSKQARQTEKARAAKFLEEEKVRQNGTNEKLDVVTEVFSEVNLAHEALGAELNDAREEVTHQKAQAAQAAVKEEIKNSKQQDEVAKLRQTIASLNQGSDDLMRRLKEKEKELTDITEQLAQSISHQAKSQIYIEERDALGSDKIKLTTQLGASQDELARLSKLLVESNEALAKVQKELLETQDQEREFRMQLLEANGIFKGIAEAIRKSDSKGSKPPSTPENGSAPSPRPERPLATPVSAPGPEQPFHASTLGSGPLATSFVQSGSSSPSLSTSGGQVNMRGGVSHLAAPPGAAVANFHGGGPILVSCPSPDNNTPHNGSTRSVVQGGSNAGGNSPVIQYQSFSRILRQDQRANQVASSNFPQNANASNGNLQPSILSRDVPRATFNGNMTTSQPAGNTAFPWGMPPPPPMLPHAPMLPVAVSRNGIPGGFEPADPAGQPTASNGGMGPGQSASNIHNSGGARHQTGVRQPGGEVMTPATESVTAQSIVARGGSQNGQTQARAAPRQSGNSQAMEAEGLAEAQERPKKRTRITDGSGTQVKRPRMTPSANVSTTADMQGQKNYHRGISTGTIIVASSTEKPTAVTKSPATSKKA